jgi:hypothetical protein
MVPNPWHLLPTCPPFVHRDDAEAVQSFNEQATPAHYLHVDAVLPEPFLGNRDAPVVLLSNNPGYSGKGLAFKTDPRFIERMRCNLLHMPLDYPFIYLSPDLNGPSRDWWERKLKHLLRRFGREVVAASLFEVVYFPYLNIRRIY